MNYILLFCGTAQDWQAWEALSEETRAQQYEQVGRWFAEHGPRIRGTHQLQPPHMATSVHFTAEGKPLVTDGPFLEGTEVIGGYAEIEVADLDEALALAKTWPGHGVVEIRPVVPHELIKPS
jgi:hypothetical protein